jgi:hypothetical protein
MVHSDNKLTHAGFTDSSLSCSQTWSNSFASLPKRKLPGVGQSVDEEAQIPFGRFLGASREISDEGAASGSDLVLVLDEII